MRVAVYTVDKGHTYMLVQCVDNAYVLVQYVDKAYVCTTACSGVIAFSTHHDADTPERVNCSDTNTYIHTYAHTHMYTIHPGT